MRALRTVGLCLLACLPPLGCEALPAMAAKEALAPKDGTMVSPPGEDGTRFVMVESGRFTSPRRLQKRWQATVKQVCEGESMTLGESSHARRQAGVVRSRIHEGYVRCLLEDDEPSPDADAPTVADAKEPSEAKPPRTGRRRKLRAPRLGLR